MRPFSMTVNRGLYENMSKLSPTVGLQLFSTIFTGHYSMFSRSTTREQCCVPSLAHGVEFALCPLLPMWELCLVSALGNMGDMCV